MRRLILVLYVASVVGIVLVVTGCGPATDETPTAETVVGDVTEPAAPMLPEGDPEAGRQVFLDAGCGSCHILGDAGTSGTIGPNLDESMPSLELAVDRVTNGQGAMPAFGDQLTEEQIADVATYVVAATQG